MLQAMIAAPGEETRHFWWDRSLQWETLRGPDDTWEAEFPQRLAAMGVTLSDEMFEQYCATYNLTEVEAIQSLFDRCGERSMRSDPASSQLCLNQIIEFGQRRGLLARPKLTPLLMTVLVGAAAGLGVAVGFHLGKR